MNVDKIISESINRVIAEGFAGKHLEQQVNQEMSKIENWFCKEKDVKRSITIYFNANLNGILKQNFPEEKTIETIIYYMPKKTYPTRVCGQTRVDTIWGFISIVLYVGNTAQVDDIKWSLLHELTHVMDVMIKDEKHFNLHRHQMGDTSLYHNIPEEIRLLLYHLWDTTEFNAWQTYVYGNTDRFNEFTEQLMKYIKKANSIDDEKVWEEVRNYLWVKTNWKLRKKTLGYIKKYFINTSFKKIKDFIKKAR